jgi:hypothetical protein
LPEDAQDCGAVSRATKRPAQQYAGPESVKQGG